MYLAKTTINLYIGAIKGKTQLQYHGLIGLYRYYCFLFKIYPSYPKKYKITYQMRQDPLFGEYGERNLMYNGNQLLRDFNHLFTVSTQVRG